MEEEVDFKITEVCVVSAKAVLQQGALAMSRLKWHCGASVSIGVDLVNFSIHEENRCFRRDRRYAKMPSGGAFFHC